MRWLRTIPTRRLLALCAAALATAIGGTALAVAASGGGPTPADKPLANAVHDALAAPSADGVSGRITFTNRLLDGIDLRGSDPLLTGASGRFWATKDGRLRLELQSTGGGQDAQFVSDGKSWWAYDGKSNTVYRGSVSRRHGKDSADATRGGDQVPTIAKIQDQLNKLSQHLDLAGAQGSDVNGRPAYTVRVSPKRSGGLIGAAELAWDADHGVPLRAALYARGDSSPVLEVAASDVKFGSVDTSVFDIPMPSGAKPQDVSPPSSRDNGKEGRKHAAPVTGLSKVQAKLPFKLAAPGTLAGRDFSETRLVGNDGALVTYGDGLDGIAVLEHKPGPQSDKQGQGGAGGPLGRTELPTVSIDGTSAQELSTPLGTVIRFERGGVSYTVIGSVDKATAEAAARAL